MGKPNKNGLQHGHTSRNPATGRVWVSPTYSSWASMKARCDGTNPKCFKNYHLKGVKYCNRWKRFENFLADMGERPEGTTLDRIDSSKGYFPGNCRWATAKVQQRHAMKVSDIQAAIIAKTKFCHGGQSALARELGVSAQLINGLNIGVIKRR